MSKKKRAQHTAPRRYGDRNVETRYSGKHQSGSCGENGKQAEGMGLTFIPEIRIKIRELHIHMDERMESMNFNSGCEVVLCGGCSNEPNEDGFCEDSDCCGDCGNTDESHCDCCGCNDEEDGYEE